MQTLQLAYEQLSASALCPLPRIEFAQEALKKLILQVVLPIFAAGFREVHEPFALFAQF